MERILIAMMRYDRYADVSPDSYKKVTSIIYRSARHLLLSFDQNNTSITVKLCSTTLCLLSGVCFI